MKYRDTKIGIGGLMRCCIATIDAYVDEHADEDVADVDIWCEHGHGDRNEDARIILRTNVWRWRRPSVTT